jgi:hypothetical protein
MKLPRTGGFAVRRLLLCLPLCLILAPSEAPKLEPTADKPKALAADCYANCDAVCLCAGCWCGPTFYPLPDEAAMEKLAKTDPIAFLHHCLRRYDREVSGYRLTLDKTERLDGKMQPQETIAVSFREQPFSALLDWQKNARLVKRSLFVKGQNNDKVLVLPNGRLLSLAGVVERDVDGEAAKKSGRYPQSEFGVKIGMVRTVTTWETAKKANALHIEYLGQKKIAEVGNRVCYVFKRAPYDKPEEDGVTEITICVDKETWLQVGSILKGTEGKMIAEYYFHDIKLNPDFKPETFTRKGLNP